MDLIHIVIGDDHPLVREGTLRILEQYPDLVVDGEAGDGVQVLELIERLQPDVAILDIRMPKLNGIEVVRQMKLSCPKTRALMLTAYDDDDYVLALMEAGASGYLLKTVRAAELVNAVRAIHEGEPVLHPAIAAKVARMWAQRRIAVEPESPKSLSTREREVLELAGKGFRNKAIAEGLFISIRTVEGHFNNILNKLGVGSRLEAVLYAVSQRWIELDEEGRS